MCHLFLVCHAGDLRIANSENGTMFPRKKKQRKRKTKKKKQQKKNNTHKQKQTNQEPRTLLVAVLLFNGIT